MHSSHNSHASFSESRYSNRSLRLPHSSQFCQIPLRSFISNIRRPRRIMLPKSLIFFLLLKNYLLPIMVANLSNEMLLLLVSFYTNQNCTMVLYDLCATHKIHNYSMTFLV